MDPLYTLMCVALANWIYMIIHVEKTLGQCNVKGVETIFQWEEKITKHLQKSNVFWLYIEGINISDIL